MKYMISVALFAMVLASAFACDSDKISQCGEEIAAKARKMAQEAMASKSESMKELMCDLGQTFVDCVKPALEGCGGEVEDSFERSIEIYNKDPYNCDLTVGAGTAVATVLTVVVAAIFAAKFN